MVMVKIMYYIMYNLCACIYRVRVCGQILWRVPW